MQKINWNFQGQEALHCHPHRVTLGAASIGFPIVRGQNSELTSEKCLQAPANPNVNLDSGILSAASEEMCKLLFTMLNNTELKQSTSCSKLHKPAFASVLSS